MIEYLEDWASIESGWTELLNKHGQDGWQLVQAVLDELDQDGRRHVGRHRLIFLREVLEDDEDEDGEEQDA